MKEIVKYLVKIKKNKSCASSERDMVSEKGQDPESESIEERKKRISLVSHVRNELYFSTQKKQEV